MDIQTLPDISHLSADDIIRVTEAASAAQASQKREFFNHMLSKVGEISKVDAANVRKVTDLIAATKDNGDCGGGIVCGC